MSVNTAMETRQLGVSDLRITPIGLGTWAIGGGAWEFGWGPQDDDESVATIHRALDMGVMLRAVSLWRSEYQLLDLLDSERIVGSIRPAGALRRGVEATLPDDLPLEVRVFILWVVLLLWRGRRVTRAAASD